MRHLWTRLSFCFTVICFAVLATNLDGRAALGGELRVGGAMTSITPDEPVALSGQMHTRIAHTVETPCTATALALETVEGDEVVGQTIMVSCDLVYITDDVLQAVRNRLKERLSDFDAEKLFLTATHTHTAPVFVEGLYQLPENGVMQPAEYTEFLVGQLTDVIAEAWEQRAAGRVGWGLGHAVVAQNRRAQYADGTAVMYGPTDRANFRGIEGYEDHDVNVLFFWNDKQELIATAINVSCPAQEVEGRSAVNADFWHPVREMLREKHGEDLLVLGMPGASGDQSPHLMYNEKAEERMRELRGLTRLEELARRIVRGWEVAYAGAKQDIRDDLPLVHHVAQIELPIRQVTENEYVDAQKQVELLSKDPTKQRRTLWQQKVVDRYKSQAPEDVYEMELHAVRLGDVAIATNDFELFTDYGIQMKARSAAVQTFIVQLCGGGTYLPTERAKHGGGYSAIVQSSEVGPEGGQVLVDETVAAIDALWSE